MAQDVKENRANLAKYRKIFKYAYPFGDKVFKRLMINHPNCMPLEVVFEDYGIEEIKGKTTYTLSVVKNI